MKVFLGVLLGAVLGGLAAMIGGFVLGDLFGVSQAEGAYAMQVIFFMTPAAAILGAIIGGVVGWRR